nr:MAG TPA: hypothetical protein [Caudoviricetes sp.]
MDKNLLVENSLYKTPAEMNDLLNNKEGVANAFFINLFGTLGLLKISSKRGTMKTHLQDDGQLRLGNIADTNKDISLSVKLAVSAGILKFAVAQEITRLLFALKSKQIKGEDLADAPLRDILSKIQYKAHRPHVSLLPIIEGFADGTLNIQQVAKQMFLTVKSRKKELMPFAAEFYELAKQYSVYFPKVDDTPMTAKAAKAQQAASAQIQPQAPLQTASGVTVQPVTIAQSSRPVPTKAAPPTPIPPVQPPAPAPKPKETIDQFVARVWNQNMASANLLNQGYYDDVKKQLDDIHSGGYQKALMEIINSKRPEIAVMNFDDLKKFTEEGFGAVIKALSADAWFAYNLFWLQTNIIGYEFINSTNVALMGSMRSSGVKAPELIRPFADVVQIIIGFWITYLVNANDKSEYKRVVNKMKSILSLVPDAAKAIMIFDPVAWVNIMKKNNINEHAVFKAFAGPLFAGLGDFNKDTNGIADWKALLTNYKVDNVEKKVNATTIDQWLYDTLNALAEDSKTGWRLFVGSNQAASTTQSTAASATKYTITQLADDVLKLDYSGYMSPEKALEVKNKLLKFAPDISFAIHSLLDFAFPNNSFLKLTEDEFLEFMTNGFGAFLDKEYPHEDNALQAMWVEANVKKLSNFTEAVNSMLGHLLKWGDIGLNKGIYRNVNPKEIAEKVCETVLASWVERIDTTSTAAFVKSLTVNGKQMGKVNVASVELKTIYPQAVLDYLENQGVTADYIALVILGTMVGPFPKASNQSYVWDIERNNSSEITKRLASKGIFVDGKTKTIGGIDSAHVVELLEAAIKASGSNVKIVTTAKGDYATPFAEGFHKFIGTLAVNMDFHAEKIAGQLVGLPNFVSLFEAYMKDLLNLQTATLRNYSNEVLATVRQVHKILLDEALEKKGGELDYGIDYETTAFWYTLILMQKTALFDVDTQKRLATLIVRQDPIKTGLPYGDLKGFGFTDDWLFERATSALFNKTVSIGRLASFIPLFAERATVEIVSALKEDGYSLRQLMSHDAPFEVMVAGLGIGYLIDVSATRYDDYLYNGFKATSLERQKQLVTEVLDESRKSSVPSRIDDEIANEHVDYILDLNLMRLIGGGDRYSLPWVYEFVRGYFEKNIAVLYDHFPSPAFAIKFAEDEVVESRTKDRVLRDIQKVKLTYGGNTGFRSYKNFIVENATEIIKRTTKPEVIDQLASSLRPVFEDLGQVRDINEIVHLANFMIAIDDKNPSAANEIYSQMTTTARGKLIKSIAGPILFKSIHDRLMGEEIRPENKAKPEDIPSMLARNNIDLTKRTAVGKKVSFREALNNSMDDSFLPDLKAVRVDNKDQDELDKASARLNGLFRSNKKHGPEGLEVLAIYDTSITNGPEWDEFAAERSKNGEPNQYFETVWHGTGTVGGAMILRFGFKIAPFDRATMAGRALGNGVYFAKFTDKSLQYLRDDTNRITRCVGNIGYLFEMEAQIGRAAKKNSQPCGPDEGVTCDHRSGGFAEATNHQDFLSPEWAVFKEKGQLRIKKVYKVKIVDLPVWKANCIKHGINPV